MLKTEEYFFCPQLREYELAQDFNGKHPEHTEYEVIKVAELPTDEKENFVEDDQREKVGELFIVRGWIYTAGNIKPLGLWAWIFLSLLVTFNWPLYDNAVIYSVVSALNARKGHCANGNK